MDRISRSLLLSLALAATSPLASAHGGAEAHYIANEGVLVTDGDTKVMFDPLFHKGFANYHTPSNEQRAKMLAGEAPFDDIDVIFISHAHGDHFGASDVLELLNAQPGFRLVAPMQAMEELFEHEDWDDALEPRLVPLDIALGETRMTIELAGGPVIDVVRVPHSGWPERADVQNLVYRVTLNGETTVMHMGDAHPEDTFFAPYEETWAERATDMGFPPYWFFSNMSTVSILKDRLRMKEIVGVHLPVLVPNGIEAVRAAGLDYFSVPGETREIPHEHEAGDDE